MIMTRELYDTLEEVLLDDVANHTYSSLGSAGYLACLTSEAKVGQEMPAELQDVIDYFGLGE
jgi:hypothetical protein